MIASPLLIRLISLVSKIALTWLSLSPLNAFLILSLASSLDLLFLIFPGLGLIFIILGGAGIAVKVRKNKLEKRLKENGETIYADYVETAINTVYSVNGRHPYNIICEWNNPRDGKKYIFKSKNIWINPESIIKERNIKTFLVYVNLENIKQYFVDVDNLTQNVVDLR